MRLFQEFLWRKHAPLLPYISIGPFKTQFRNQDIENIFKEKPSEHTENSIRLLLHIHKHPRSSHYQPKHNTIQVGHSAVLKSLPATLRAKHRGLYIPSYVPLGLRLCNLGIQSQKTVSQSGCHRQEPAISVAGGEDLSAKRGLVSS